MGGALIPEDFFGAGGAQETGYEVFGGLAGGEFCHSAVEDGWGEKGMRDPQTIGFAVGDGANQIQALRRERLGISQTDDEELFCLEGSGRRFDQDGFAQVSAKQCGCLLYTSRCV